MSRLQVVEESRLAMGTIVNLTGVFEGLASMRISQVKNQVLSSQQFFNELWSIYRQLRVDTLFRFGRSDNHQIIDKELVIVITAEGGFGGDIDQRLIHWMLESHNPNKQDIMIIGHHGAMQLMQAGVGFKKYFALPSRDTNINIRPLVQEVSTYKSTVVYYQTYVSLMSQEIKRIELQTAVAEKAKEAEGSGSEDVISENNYIFEPSTFEVVAHLERSMTEIALSQVILDSKLAQYASRFRAMSMANDKADEMFATLTMQYNRTKRRIQDERLKEMINGLRVGANT